MLQCHNSANDSILQTAHSPHGLCSSCTITTATEIAANWPLNKRNISLLIYFLYCYQCESDCCLLYLSSLYLHTERTVKQTPQGHQNLSVSQPLLSRKQLINKHCCVFSYCVPCRFYSGSVRHSARPGNSIFLQLITVVTRNISCSILLFLDSCAIQETHAGSALCRNRQVIGMVFQHLSVCLACSEHLCFLKKTGELKVV